MCIARCAAVMMLTCIEDALPGGRVDHRAVAAGVVKEVIRIKHQIQIFGGLGEKERLHAILQLVVVDVLDLRIQATRHWQV